MRCPGKKGLFWHKKLKFTIRSMVPAPGDVKALLGAGDAAQPHWHQQHSVLHQELLRGRAWPFPKARKFSSAQT